MLRVSDGRKYDVLPEAYIRNAKTRPNVKELPKEKIQEIMKTASNYEEQVILQDLLLAGRKMETETERNMVVLAAELYVKSSAFTRGDFIPHIMQDPTIFQNFIKAIGTNANFREEEPRVIGRSNLTDEEIIREKRMANYWSEFIK